MVALAARALSIDTVTLRREHYCEGSHILYLIHPSLSFSQRIFLSSLYVQVNKRRVIKC